MNIKIRKAEAADIEAMIALLAALFSREPDFIVDRRRQSRGLEMMLEDETNRCVFVAEYQGKVIGMCSAQLLVSTSEGGYKALVEDVFVSEEFHGGGIGRQLLSSLEKWAITKDVKRLDLMADRNNESGLSFYRKIKWKHTDLIVLQKRNIE